jgi:peptide/nickel transport system substrate-binding protein
MLGTDFQALLTGAVMDMGTLSNGTPIGPSFADYYLDQPHVPDVEKAKQLLAQAGYPDGTTIRLTTQNAAPSPAIATVWKEQMAKIGVTVDIQQVPVDVYYGGSGENNWLECDFGITDWGARPNPVNYFQLSLVTDGPYNESHWSDAEFDALTAKIATEMDEATRADLYKQAQKILIDRGPYIIPFFLDGTIGVSPNIGGVVVTQDIYNIVFDTVHYTE